MASTFFSRFFVCGHRLASPCFFLPQKGHTLPSILSPTSAYTSYTISALACRIVAPSGVGSRAGFSTQLLSGKEPVVSVDWLHANIKDPNLKFIHRLDCIFNRSWLSAIVIKRHLSATELSIGCHLAHAYGAEKRIPKEYQSAHLPGARFFDLDGISDRRSNFLYMLPSEEAFAAACSALGIENTDGLVVYDAKGIFSAARVWWMFRVFGHERVCVLDGGLPRWRASGYNVESCASSDAILKARAAIEATERVYQGQTVSPTTFKAKFQPHLVWTLEQVKKNMEEKSYQQLDSRGKPWFDGTAPAPYAGLQSGHVPGSKCVPYTQMLDSSQMLLPPDELKKKFEEEGISLDRPIMTSCAVGITACILALGLHRLGKKDVPVYDGSWMEWASQSDLPIESSSSVR